MPLRIDIQENTFKISNYAFSYDNLVKELEEIRTTYAL